MPALLPTPPGAQRLPQDMILNPTAAKYSCLLYCSAIHLYLTWRKMYLGMVRLMEAFHIFIATVEFIQQYFLIHKNA